MKNRVIIHNQEILLRLIFLISNERDRKRERERERDRKKKENEWCLIIFFFYKIVVFWIKVIRVMALFRFNGHSMFVPTVG